jgi:hypothetical protein
MKFDSPSLVNEAFPVVGYESETTSGEETTNAIVKQKTFNLTSELKAGRRTVWSSNQDMQIKKVRIDVGTPGVGGNTYFELRLNNTPIKISQTIMGPGVKTLVIWKEDLTTDMVVTGDLISVHIVQTEAVTNPFHMTTQLEYT